MNIFKTKYEMLKNIYLLDELVKYLLLVQRTSRILKTLVLSFQLRVFLIQLWMQDILDPVIHLPAIAYQEIQRDRELFPKLREKSIQHWVIQNIIRVRGIKKCKICDDKGLTLPICSMNLVSLTKIQVQVLQIIFIKCFY